MKPEERGECSKEAPQLESTIHSGEAEADPDLFDSLYKATMGNQWNRVVKILSETNIDHCTKLTKSMETPLHAAISSYHPRTPSSHQEHLNDMIEVMTHKGTLKHVLAAKNQKGDTPLHLAAAVGWRPIFDSVEKEDPDRLFHSRNNKRETPLFLAALHGNLGFFRFLHGRFKPHVSLARREDGDTILHRAIFEENFELAYAIIDHYPELVDYKNEDGESPLHVLAKKPNVFKSSSHLRIYDSIIYYSVCVEDLSSNTDSTAPAAVETDSSNTDSTAPALSYPENYTTCVKILSFIRGCIAVIFKKQPICATDEENHYHQEHEPQTKENGYNDSFPGNYVTCINLFKFAVKVILIIIGVGFWRVKKIKEKKRKYLNGMQVLDKMLENESEYKIDNTGQNPGRPQEDSGKIKIPDEPPQLDNNNNVSNQDTTTERTSSTKTDDTAQNKQDKEAKGSVTEATPLLVAARTGILEMVKKIHTKFNVSIKDLDSDEKNVLMLAAEHRHTAVFHYLIDEAMLPEYMFRQFDKDGNSILHLAAKFTELYPWRIPGAALQMQWEIKWYKHVKRSLSTHSISQPNKEGKTPRTIFTQTHKDLRKAGSEWLIKTSESCSVVAALIAAVAFATSSTVPGGLTQEKGKPVLQHEKAFDVFSMASLVALCLSVTALVFFLAIITSRCEERDFKGNLTRKLLAGLSSLFASIAAILLSFCSGHTFILREELKFAVIPIYASITVPVVFFAIAQLPLYFDLLRAAYLRVPLRSYKVFSY